MRPGASDLGRFPARRALPYIDPVKPVPADSQANPHIVERDRLPNESTPGRPNRATPAIGPRRVRFARGNSSYVAVPMVPGQLHRPYPSRPYRNTHAPAAAIAGAILVRDESERERALRPKFMLKSTMGAFLRQRGGPSYL